MRRIFIILLSCLSLAAWAEETNEIYGGFVVAPLTDGCQAVGTVLASTEYANDEIGLFCGTTPLTDYTATAVEAIPEEKEARQITREIYNLQGIRLAQPQHGLYLQRMSDGSVRKVLVK